MRKTLLRIAYQKVSEHAKADLFFEDQNRIQRHGYVCRLMCNNELVAYLDDLVTKVISDAAPVYNMGRVVPSSVHIGKKTIEGSAEARWCQNISPALYDPLDTEFFIHAIDKNGMETKIFGVRITAVGSSYNGETTVADIQFVAKSFDTRSDSMSKWTSETAG